MKRLKDVVGGVLGIAPSQITDATSPENTASWDSLNGLLMVSELESAYKVKFTLDEIMGVKNFADIKSALRAHNVKFEE